MCGGHGQDAGHGRVAALLTGRASGLQSANRKSSYHRHYFNRPFYPPNFSALGETSVQARGGGGSGSGTAPRRRSRCSPQSFCTARTEAAAPAASLRRLPRPCPQTRGWSSRSPPVLTRTSQSLRTGYAYQTSCVLYVPEAQGSLPRVGQHCTYAARVPAAGVPYVPHTVAPHRSPPQTSYAASCSPAQTKSSSGGCARTLRSM